MLVSKLGLSLFPRVHFPLELLNFWRVYEKLKVGYVRVHVKHSNRGTFLVHSVFPLEYQDLTPQDLLVGGFNSFGEYQ